MSTTKKGLIVLLAGIVIIFIPKILHTGSLAFVGVATAVGGIALFAGMGIAIFGLIKTMQKKNKEALKEIIAEGTKKSKNE